MNLLSIKRLQFGIEVTIHVGNRFQSTYFSNDMIDESQFGTSEKLDDSLFEKEV